MLKQICFSVLVGIAYLVSIISKEIRLIFIDELKAQIFFTLNKENNDERTEEKTVNQKAYESGWSCWC
jgi:hypothetical protein